MLSPFDIWLAAQVRVESIESLARRLGTGREWVRIRVEAVREAEAKRAFTGALPFPTKEAADAPPPARSGRRPRPVRPFHQRRTRAEP